MTATAWSYSRLTQFETCPKRFWHTSIQKDWPETKSEEQSYGTKVHKALELRVSKNKPLPNELRQLEPIANKLYMATGEKLTEQQLAIDDSFRPVKWFDKSVWCRGIVDLAIVAPPHAVSIDYKTGKMDDDFTQQRLATSLLMLHNKLIQTADVVYLWLKNRKLTKEPMTRADMAGVWSELIPRVRRYQKAFDMTEFPARPSGLCKKHCHITSCPYNGANT